MTMEEFLHLDLMPEVCGWGLFLFLPQYILLYAGQRGHEFLEANFAHTIVERTPHQIDFRLQQLWHTLNPISLPV